MPSEKFGRKVLIAAVAYDRLVTLTKARQQTNTPNTHTLSPLTGAWFMVWFFCRALIGSWTLMVPYLRDEREREPQPHAQRIGHPSPVFKSWAVAGERAGTVTDPLDMCGPQIFPQNSRLDQITGEGVVALYVFYDPYSHSIVSSPPWK